MTTTTSSAKPGFLFTMQADVTANPETFQSPIGLVIRKVFPDRRDRSIFSPETHTTQREVPRTLLIGFSTLPILEPMVEWTFTKSNP